MDKRVDLTQNSIFSVQQARSNSAGITQHDFPWAIYMPTASLNSFLSASGMKEIKSDKELSDVSDSSMDVYEGLLIVGAKEDRAKTREMVTYMSSDFCDCCGKDLRVVPWEKSFCLCASCADKLEAQIESKAPWDYGPIHPANETTDRNVIELNHPGRQ